LQPSQSPFTMTLEVENVSLILALAGPRGQMLAAIARASGADINLRGHTIFVCGEESRVRTAHRLLHQATELAGRGHMLEPNDIERAVREIEQDPDASLVERLDEVIVTQKRRQIVPKSPAQRAYVNAIRNYDLTFGIGPAGTGKTYLAMAVATNDLLSKRVKRIVLTRPAVEAGERLGFLPGDLAEKVNPYLRPLYDALNDMLDFDKVEQLRQRGQIEVAPLAFMRGRTLNDAFVILDEAQNATSEQMLMFLTRLGFGSKAVVTGDVTQTDLPAGSKSGLREAHELLRGIGGIAFQVFTHADVVRHPLVQKIVQAYDRRDARLHEEKPKTGDAGNAAARSDESSKLDRLNNATASGETVSNETID
jgi:phosphate starvation-inducible protein PhoH and related proteins